MEAAAPPIGTTFDPSPRQLIECYLRREIAAGGDELHNDYPGSGFFIRGVDVYSAAPYNLVAHHAPAPGTGDWYFFHDFINPASASSRGKRRSRIVAGTDGKGSWHTEAVERSDGGYMSKFSYQVKTPSGITKPGWLMVEYGIDGCDTVIAKIYRSPRRHQPTNAAAAPRQGAGAYYPAAAAAAAPAGQGAGYYPAAAAAALAGQGAGYPMVMDDIGNNADWFGHWNLQPEVGHVDHSLLPSHHMVPSAAAAAAAAATNVVAGGENQTVLGPADAYAQAQPQHLTPDVVFQPHIASTSGGALPYHLELAYDDEWWDDYNNTN